MSGAHRLGHGQFPNITRTGRRNMIKMHRRQLLTTTAGAIALATLVLSSRFAPVQAQDKMFTIGIGLPLTGADADSATRIKNGALMAIEEVNGKGGVGGYK